MKEWWHICKTISLQYSLPYDTQCPLNQHPDKDGCYLELTEKEDKWEGVDLFKKIIVISDKKEDIFDKMREIYYGPPKTCFTSSMPL